MRTFGFCSIILLIMQRTFSPPLNTDVFFFHDLFPAEQHFTQKALIKSSSTSLVPGGTNCRKPVHQVVIASLKIFAVVVWQVCVGDSGAPFKCSAVGFHFAVDDLKNWSAPLGRG